MRMTMRDLVALPSSIETEQCEIAVSWPRTEEESSTRDLKTESRALL